MPRKGEDSVDARARANFASFVRKIEDYSIISATVDVKRGGKRAKTRTLRHRYTRDFEFTYIAATPGMSHFESQLA